MGQEPTRSALAYPGSLLYSIMYWDGGALSDSAVAIDEANLSSACGSQYTDCSVDALGKVLTGFLIYDPAGFGRW
ncbi:MAG: hypothetical protein JSW22_00515 [Chloroflexota bacterium]|nr:MAG: hypothetical protein JSW22_00515 [Chloroflexota bacterium]